MPPEYYLGAGVAVILLVLLVSLARGKGAKRPVAEKSIGTDQLAEQLSRIANALEKLAGRPEAPAPQTNQAPAQPIEAAPPRAGQISPLPAAPAPPPRAEPAAPPRDEEVSPAAQRRPEPSPAAEAKTSETEKKPHVSLSMFGR